MCEMLLYCRQVLFNWKLQYWNLEIHLNILINQKQPKRQQNDNDWKNRENDFTKTTTHTFVS